LVTGLYVGFGNYYGGEYFGDSTSPVNLGLSANDGYGGTVTALASTGTSAIGSLGVGSPGLSLTFLNSGSQQGNYEVSGTVNYSFEVTGAEGTTADVTLTGNSSLYVQNLGNNGITGIGPYGPPATAIPYLNVAVSSTQYPSNTFPNDVDLYVLNNGGLPSPNGTQQSTSFDSGQITVDTDTDYYVTLQASLTGTFGSSGSAYVTLDPVITLDTPGDLLLLPDNIGNTSNTTAPVGTVPDPLSTLLAVASGLGMLLGVKRLTRGVAGEPAA
jgi:hypothetical protein